MARDWSRGHTAPRYPPRAPKQPMSFFDDDEPALAGVEILFEAYDIIAQPFWKLDPVVDLALMGTLLAEPSTFLSLEKSSL